MQKKILIILSILLVSCNQLPDSKGEFNEIIIISSIEDKKILEPIVDEYIFESVLYTPEPEFLIEGDFGKTLSQAPLRIRSAAALAHCDIGTGLKDFDQQLARAISEDLDALLSVGAVILSDQPFEWPVWKSLALPAGVDRHRYYMYSKIS